jgi:hypothetical protein
VPQVLPRGQLTAAAALLSASQNAAVILGAAADGLLAAGPGPLTVYAAASPTPWFR